MNELGSTNNFSVANAIPQNGIRDALWSAASLLGKSLGVQTFFAAIPVTIASAVQLIREREALLAKQGDAFKKRVVQIIAPGAAAIAAMPMWALGASLFKRTALQAFGAGLLEGPTQYVVKYIARIATSKAKQAMWKKNPAMMFVQLMKKLFLNSTIGAIPGGVWFLVYHFLPLVLSGVCPPLAVFFLVMLGVTLAVGMSNYICSHAIKGIEPHLFPKWRSEYEEEKKKQQVVSKPAAIPAEPQSSDPEKVVGDSAVKFGPAA